jgi:signal transduction histidine kinase
LFDSRDGWRDGSRAGPRASAKPGGMGIGLVISRSIIEAHEGRLWAEAGPGGKFSFSIPLLDPDPHA